MWNRGRSPSLEDRWDWYARGGWSNPFPVARAPRAFGLWDGLFLWALLSNLSRPGSADFFHNHQADPGYQAWRQEADRLAADNASLRQQLEALDRELAARKGQPMDVNYLPPDVPRSMAFAAMAADRTPSVSDGAEEDGGLPWVWIALGAGVVILVVLRWRDSRKQNEAKGTDVRNLGSLGAMLRHKVSGGGYRPDRFRVGMTFSHDPTPFVLAQGATKVVPPAADTGSSRLTATAIGTLEGDGFTLTRLYLPDDRSTFQLHLDAEGSPDECRFFSVIDRVTPADQAEWGAWLDPNEGMIGWPQFQTRDGRVYDRVWSPGQARVAPIAMTETVETADGPPRQLHRQSMLYAAATGAADPAPTTEYILVSAIEADRQAWVEIAAGIDVSPGMLELS